MSSTSSGGKHPPATSADGEVDDWKLAIQRGGCAWENEKLQDCHEFTRDWRRCRYELEAFKKCWAKIDHARRRQTGQKV